MAYLVDTSILARLANQADAQYNVVARSIVELHRRGGQLHVTPQVLIEFRNAPSDFIRMAGYGPGIVVVDPGTV